MFENRGRNRKIFLYLLLFIIAGIVNWQMDTRFIAIHLITVYYCLMVVLWAESVNNRIVDQSTNRLLFFVAICLLGFVILRHTSYVYFKHSEFIRRHLWYAYNIPTTLVPLLSFFAALESAIPGTSKRKRSRLWDLFYIPEIGLCVFSLTNDSHRLVYGFPNGIEKWESGYSANILFYVILIWVTFFMLAMLFVLILSSQRGKTLRYIWIPILPLLVSDVIYYLYFMKDVKTVFEHLPYDLPEIFLFMIIGVWEGCIYIGLIASNENYREIFEKSDISAEITDESGNIIYKTTHYDPIPTEIILTAYNEPIMWDDNTRLRAGKIHGGYVGWREDISNLNLLKNRVNELHEQLRDESVVIEGENALLERRKRAEEQELIYQTVSKSVIKQVNELDAFLDSINTESPNFDRAVKRAGIFQAYIKRRCNLALLSANSKTLSVFELTNSIRESMELLTMNDIACKLYCDVTGNVDAVTTLSVYDLFELVTETLLPELCAILVRISAEGDAIIIKISADSDASLQDRLISAISEKYKGCSIEAENDSFYVSVSFFKEAVM